MAEQKPLLGATYRLLAINEPDLQAYVGRTIRIEDILVVSYPNHMWRVTGHIQGTIGTTTLTCALQKSTGNCNCRAYDFPHSKTRACT